MGAPLEGKFVNFEGACDPLNYFQPELSPWCILLS